MSELEPVHQSNLAEIAALEPPGRALDRAVAVRVLGLAEPEKGFERQGWLTDHGFKELPHFSTDRLAWLEVLEALLEETARWRKSYSMK